MVNNQTQSAYTQNAGLTSIPSVFLANEDPTVNSLYGTTGLFPVGQRWLNQTTDVEWVLFNLTSVSGTLQADWQSTGGKSGEVNTLTGDDGFVISPDASGNINILGNVVANATHAKAVFTEESATATMRIDVQAAAAIVSTDVTKVGLAAFSSTDFNVDANGFVSLTGGSGPAIQGVTVDAHTPPGTSPVVPNGSGNIIVTGGQVAAGTTVNVIQTDSLAANTYTIQVQRSQSVASSTVGDNGVCHFSNANFSVDSNGFVTGIGGGLAWVDVVTTSQAMSVNTAYTANNGSLVTLTLPSTAAYGSVIKVAGKGTGGWMIAQNSGQTIHFISLNTTTGVGGSLASTKRYDEVTLVCEIANTDWAVIGSEGNITIV